MNPVVNRVRPQALGPLGLHYHVSSSCLDRVYWVEYNLTSSSRLRLTNWFGAQSIIGREILRQEFGMRFGGI